MRDWVGLAFGILLLVVLVVFIGWGATTAVSCWVDGGTWVPNAWPEKCLIR